MITPLVTEVEQLREAMTTHRSHLVASEAATRYALIDRILLLLGWDVHDASRVTPEYAAGAASNARVDYALLHGGAPVALIEAKSLQTKLQDKEIEQLNTYCSNRSVRWGILTDGDRWKLLDASRFATPLLERVVLEFALSEGTAITALQNLVTLFAAVTGRSEGVAQSTRAHLPPPVAKPSLDQPPPPTRTESAGTPLPELVREARPKAKCRVRLAFPDGQRQACRSWAEVLEHTLGWLAATGSLTPARCPLPDVAGRGRYLVHTEAVHPSGSAFRDIKRLADGLVYQTNYNAADCCRNAVHALQTLGVDPASVTWTPLD